MPARVERVHLIGIAGAAMGAFACMLKDAGYSVCGSDLNVYPPMSTVLAERGIAWMEGFAAEHLAWAPEGQPEGSAEGPPPDLVIVGNVCRRDNPEVLEADRRGITAVSFPQAFCDLFLQGRTPVVITGTHGKTTTTGLLTWMLDATGRRPGMLLGGVHRNFDAAYRLMGGPGDPFVVEGDEYDTAFFDKGPKFLHYQPRLAVLNNIEFDHADIYDTLDEIIENFDRFIDLMGPGTVLLANGDDPLVMARAARAQGDVITYGFGEGLDLRATDVVPDAEGATFKVWHKGRLLGEVRSALAGRHNVWNGLAALGIGLQLGVPFADLAASMAGYAGVKKRQEERGEAGGVLVVDDYAHHPTAIRETVAALRRRYPGRRLWAVYEPKSNTARRNVHQADYATAFDEADRAVVARAFNKKNDFGEDERLDLDRLVAEIAQRGTPAFHAASTDDALAHLVAEVRQGDVVVFMSGSGFDGIHDRLLASLTASPPPPA